MDVAIRLEQHEPPVGVVTVPAGEGGDPGVTFEGWLGLLRALTEVMDAHRLRTPEPPDDQGR